jgi:hypothetical protein
MVHVSLPKDKKKSSGGNKNTGYFNRYIGQTQHSVDYPARTLYFRFIYQYLRNVNYCNRNENKLLK